MSLSFPFAQPPILTKSGIFLNLAERIVLFDVITVDATQEESVFAILFNTRSAPPRLEPAEVVGSAKSPRGAKWFVEACHLAGLLGTGCEGCQSSTMAGGLTRGLDEA